MQLVAPRGRGLNPLVALMDLVGRRSEGVVPLVAGRGGGLGPGAAPRGPDGGRPDRLEPGMG